MLLGFWLHSNQSPPCGRGGPGGRLARMGATDLAPSFTQKPQLRQEDDGNRLIFECQLVCHPKPDIAWFREDTELSENDRTTMTAKEIGPNKFLVVLELDDVVETDAGMYKVKAKNKLGEVAASISLNFSRELLLFLHFSFPNYHSWSVRDRFIIVALILYRFFVFFCIDGRFNTEISLSDSRSIYNRCFDFISILRFCIDL